MYKVDKIDAYLKLCHMEIQKLQEKLMKFQKLIAPCVQVSCWQQKLQQLSGN